jgi:TctA family transporter
MARKGRAGPALASAGLGSFFAGSVGTLILAAFAPPLTELAFKFGPAEYFALMVLGLIGAVVLASGSLIKAVAMIILGLLLGLIGTDVNSGVARFSFDVPELTDGIGFVVLAMGIFGYGEIISNLSQPEHEREVFTSKVTGLMPTVEDLKRMAPAVLRGTVLAPCWASCPAVGRCWRRLRPTPLRRSWAPSRARFPSGSAISAVWRLPSRPTTRALRPLSFRC